MKRFYFLFFILLPVGLAAVPQLSWRLANPRIIRISGLDRLEFDVQVKASEAGTLFWSGQFNITFNNSAFSTSAADVTTMRSGISAQFSDLTSDYKYNIIRTVTGASPNLVVNVALTPTDISILGESPSSESSAEMTTSWQTFLKLRLKVADASALAGISFIQASMNGQESYHGGPGVISYYQNPNLYASLDFQQLWIARIFSAMGWSQVGSSVNNVQFTDWSTAVNTSVWEGLPVLDGGSFLMDRLRIHSGAVLSLTDDADLTVSGDLVNDAGSSGLVLASSASGSASLIHQSDGVEAAVDRFISGSASLTQMTYHLVSVPVASGAVSGWWADSYLYRFDAPSQAWVSLGSSASTPLSVDQGYMVYYPAAEKTYTFNGPLLNGVLPLAVGFHVAGGFSGLNLVPNPYPSAIDWNSLAGWSKTNIANAFWIWNPSAGNYASYGSYGTLNATQFIPQGQAFFVKAIDASPVLSVNNSARVHSNQAFFKNSDPPGLLRFKAAANSKQDEMLVVFDGAASPAFDPQLDVAKLFGAADAPQLYAADAGGLPLTVNALNLPVQGCSVPISLQLDSEAQLALSIENVQAFDPNYELLLEDLVTGESFDLRNTNVLDITHLPSYPQLRFLLHVVKITGLLPQQTEQCVIWGSGEVVRFTHPAAAGSILKVLVQDMAGRSIKALSCVNNALNSFSVPGFNGFVSVTVIDHQGATTKKIFLNADL